MTVVLILLLLAAVVLFCVLPGAKRAALRKPFYGRNYARRGYFGKDQRRLKTACLPLPPPPKTATALNWTYNLPATKGWWFSTMTR